MSNYQNSGEENPVVAGRHDLGATSRRLILSWFGCGYARKAPGTMGSLGALPVGIAVHWALGPLALAACAAVLFVIGCLVGAAHLRNSTDAKDPQWIVIDEVVGQWIALAAVPLSAINVVLAFALFRLFDITKPWPVSWADRRAPGALGIMLDDLLAGLYAAMGGFGFTAIWTELQ